MYTFSTHRIGSRASESDNHAANSESSVLRSLFDLRKTYSSRATNMLQQNDEDAAQHLTFWNCSWTPRILQSLRKILVRDGRRFSSIKFFDCAIQNDACNGELFSEILEMILANNSTTSLVIRGGKLIGNDHSPRQQQSSCDSSQTSCSTTRFTSAMREGLSTNTSLKFLKISGMDVSPFAVQGLADAFSKNSTLESISLRQSSLDDEALALVLRSVTEHPTLTTLDLSRNYLGARKSNTASSSTIALDAVSELLQSKRSKIECLDLSHQYQQLAAGTTTPPRIYPTENQEQKHIQQHKDAFGKALAALSKNKSLRTIDLSCNPGCLSDPSTVEALALCLLDNTVLQHADISGCGMTAGSIAYLARECIPSCGTSLKGLVLFGRETAIQIASVQSCISNSQPGNSDCHDDCYCAAALALEKGLESNMTLENLGELPCSGAYRRIQQILNLNKGGRRALVQHERATLPPAAWSHLLARAGNLAFDSNSQSDSDAPSASVLFALLRQGPVLLEH